MASMPTLTANLRNGAWKENKPLVVKLLPGKTGIGKILTSIETLHAAIKKDWDTVDTMGAKQWKSPDDPATKSVVKNVNELIDKLSELATHGGDVAKSFKSNALVPASAAKWIEGAISDANALRKQVVALMK